MIFLKIMLENFLTNNKRYSLIGVFFYDIMNKKWGADYTKLDRNYIIDYIKEYAINKNYVYAMWLEGADGLNMVDEYSDLDIWFDVEDSKKNSFVDDLVCHLSLIGKIDSRMNKSTKEIYQSNIHLENTSE